MNGPLSFLNQLTHKMTKDCLLNSPKFRTCCVQILCWMSKQKQNKIFCTQHVLNLYFSGNSMNNILSYCGLTDARMRASEKDLPVKKELLSSPETLTENENLSINSDRTIFHQNSPLLNSNKASSNWSHSDNSRHRQR